MAATLELFGVLQSAMFTARVRTVGGRIRNDLRFSAETVYNTFPFATASGAQRQRIEEGALAVLDAGAAHDLYDPLAMPALVAAHRALDGAVDRLYSGRTLRSCADRLAILFDRYTATTTDNRWRLRRSPFRLDGGLYDGVTARRFATSARRARVRRRTPKAR